MPSSYPGAYDNLPARTDASPATPNAHADDHTDERDAINAIQAELGLDPAGASATVKARLDALDTTVAGKEAAGVAAALVDDLSGVTNQSGARTSLGLGTSATLNVPAAGDAASGEVVKGNDSRLTNSRTPAAHAASHGSAGSDPITIANTQVTGLGSIATQAANNVAITGGSIAGVTGVQAQPASVTFSNVDYTVTATTGVIVRQTGTMTAPRVVTLPAASSFRVGDELIVIDSSGSVTTTNTLTIQRAGSDTIAGGTSLVMGTGYAWRRLVSDGVSAWLFDAGVLRSSNNLSDLASASTARTNLGLGTAATRNAPATGNAASTETVLGSDTRLTDARTPTSHVHAGTDITSGTVDPARLGTGTSISTKFLRGDSTWQTVASGSVATDTIFDAKGDLPVGTGADTAAKLTVGTNGHMLYADSDEATGLIWRPYRSQAMRYQADDYWLMSRQVGFGYTAVALSSTATNSNNLAAYVPFSIAEPITLKALALHCVATNAGVNAVVRLGIYNADATTGRPSTVVVDAGTSSINVANVKEISFTALTLKPGNYFYVVAAQGLDTAGTNPTFSGTERSTTLLQETAPAASNNMLSNWQTTGVTGAFAANPTVAIASRSTTARAFNVWGKIN